MAETALPRTVSGTYILERARRSRRVTGSEWQQVAVLTPTLSGGAFTKFAITFTAFAEDGLVGEVRIKTSTGILSNPALVVGHLERGVVGVIDAPVQPNYIYLEARGALGNPGGIHVLEAALTELDGSPNSLDIGPHYPPGYSPISSGADTAITSIPNVVVEQGNVAVIAVPYINNGPDTSGSFDVNVPIPSGVTFNAGASSPGCVIAGLNVRCPVSAGLADGATGTASFAFDVPNNAATGVQNLQASIDAQSSADPVIANNSGNFSLDIQVPPTADLAFSSVNSPSADQGTQVVISPVIVNNGPNGSGAFEVALEIPNGGTFNAGASSPGCSVVGSDVVCSISNLNNGANVSTDIAFDISGAAPTGPQTLDVDIQNATIPDPTPGNNSGVSNLTISTPGGGGFPQVVASQISTNSSPVTLMSFNVPSARQTGDLLLATVSTFPSPILTAPTGWTLLHQEESGNRTMAVFAKISAGNEGFTVFSSDASARSVTSCAVIRDFNGSLVEGVGWSKGSSVSGNGTGINPPGVTANWGSANNLFVTMMVAENDGETVTAYPTGWSHHQSDGVANGQATDASCTIGVASRQLAVATADPSLFNLSGSEGYLAITLVFRPT